jgi:biotin operon repressor
MSMELMVLAMKTKVGNPLRKLVLIKLADNASDSGECWPSYHYIADQCEIGHSTVRKHIKGLEDDGLLTITPRKGPKGNDSNVYRLHLRASDKKPMLSGSTGDSLQTLQAATLDKARVLPDSIAMPADNTGVLPDSRSCATSEQTLCHQIAPESVIKPIIKPVTKRSKKTSQTKTLDFSAWPAMPSEQTLADWLVMRKRLKADVSQTVINRIAPQLLVAVSAGFSVDDCLAECVTRNWRGFQATWLGNAGVNPGQHTGTHNGDWTRHVFDPEDPLV